MYDFCDTIEQPKTNPLPAEAVCFNGVWLDSEIPGFRTLATEGREFVSRNIDTYTVGLTDGAYYRGASFGARTINVQYQMISANPYEFRENFNKLNSLLTATQAELIFADEPDKFFTATRASFNAVQIGRNSVTGTISFHCSDPKKYSVKEKEVTATVASGEVLLSIRNDGNMTTPITYEISCTSDNGYVGIESGESYIRFGSEDETDGESESVSARLLTQANLKNATSNSVDSSDVMTTATVNGNEWLGTLNPSSGSGWHGAYKAVAVPADSNGEVGAKNFYLYTMHWFQCAFTSQKSKQVLNLMDSTGKIVCGIHIEKSNTSNAKATVSHVVNGSFKRTFDFECGADPKSNPFLENKGHNDIKKEGGTITMYFFGKYYTYYDEDLEDVAVTTVQFITYDYGSSGMTRNYIKGLSFIKNDVDSWNDVSNRYGAGAVVKVNGEEGKLYVNGLPKLGDEIKGSEYFHAEPGQNEVSVHCSDWATGITVKARYREAWI